VHLAILHRDVALFPLTDQITQRLARLADFVLAFSTACSRCWSSIPFALAA